MTAAWRALDAEVRSWWDIDLARADPAACAEDATLLPLPSPYITAGGTHTSDFAEMYGWDTAFINHGLLAHERGDIVAGHIDNHLTMIERYGMVLNGNRSYYLTRSQPPLLADSIAAYIRCTGDEQLVRRAAAALAAEYLDYWCGPEHQTEAGLARAFDRGAPNLRAELAAEAETGLDFTAQYGGDARRCVPLVLNTALVRTARVLAELHQLLNEPAAAEGWHQRAEVRAQAIREHCWAEDFFYEFDISNRRHVPVRTVAAYWTLWAGVATAEQAATLVDALPDFRGPGGLASTDRRYASPHPEFTDLQWQHPAGWAPMQMIAVAGLDAYGYHEHAASIARDFVDLQVRTHAATGSLWERYDVVHDGALPTDLPVERYQVVPMHGWSAAAVAVLGRRAYAPAEGDLR